MAWRVARSLDVLLSQLNKLAPRRSKSSDGSIGDARHARSRSDHNPVVRFPGDSRGIVTARDYTHDPRGGLDCHRLAAALQRHKDSRIKYIIWNRRIMAGVDGPSPWQWRPYSGSNPHTHHLHLSVRGKPISDSTRPWDLSGMTTGGGLPFPFRPWFMREEEAEYGWMPDEEESALLLETLDEEGVGDFLGKVLGGAASGAAAGARGGPWGALLGAGVGAGMSALGAVQSPKSARSSKKRRGGKRPSRPAAAPVPPELVTQLAQVLPLLTQIAEQAEDLDDQWEYVEYPDEEIVDEAEARGPNRRRRPQHRVRVHRRRTIPSRRVGYHPVRTYAGLPAIQTNQQQVAPYPPASDGVATQIADLLPLLSQIAQGATAQGQIAAPAPEQPTVSAPPEEPVAVSVTPERAPAEEDGDYGEDYDENYGEDYDEAYDDEGHDDGDYHADYDPDEASEEDDGEFEGC